MSSSLPTSYSVISKGRKASPRSVSWYAVRAGNAAVRAQEAKPREVKPCNRSVRTLADTEGSRDRSSLNDSGPCMSSRSTNVVHRPEIASSATSTGQSGDGRSVLPRASGTSEASQVSVW